jgi:prepilin-type N-terminal cleavage/methylation domain-containing protein
MLNMKKIKGFTLIELLIVIALLGALAAGLLAAIDPFEQLKKGSDTSIRSQAESFYNATIAFYAQRNTLPTSLTAQSSWTGTLTSVPGSSAIAELANAGELKSDFYALAGAGKLANILVSIPSLEKIIVCYQPQSKAFRNDQYTKYDSTGATAANCPNGTSTACHQCFQ